MMGCKWGETDEWGWGHVIQRDGVVFKVVRGGMGLLGAHVVGI